MRGDVGTNDDSVPSPNEAGPLGLEAKVHGLAPVDEGRVRRDSGPREQRCVQWHREKMTLSLQSDRGRGQGTPPHAGG
jgi:hypothetical protein